MKVCLSVMLPLVVTSPHEKSRVQKKGEKIMKNNLKSFADIEAIKDRLIRLGNTTSTIDPSTIAFDPEWQVTWTKSSFGNYWLINAEGKLPKKLFVADRYTDHSNWYGRTYYKAIEL